MNNKWILAWNNRVSLFRSKCSSCATRHRGATLLLDPVPSFTIQTQPTGNNSWHWIDNSYMAVSWYSFKDNVNRHHDLFETQGRMGATSSWLGSWTHQLRLIGEHHDHDHNHDHADGREKSADDDDSGSVVTRTWMFWCWGGLDMISDKSPWIWNYNSPKSPLQRNFICLASSFIIDSQATLHPQMKADARQLYLAAHRWVGNIYKRTLSLNILQLWIPCCSWIHQTEPRLFLC